jgi:hypothetical protein
MTDPFHFVSDHPETPPHEGPSPSDMDVELELELERGSVDIRSKGSRSSRGRPSKPPPTTSMTAKSFLESDEVLTVTVTDRSGNSSTFVTNPARQNKQGKVGWTFSHKCAFCVQDTDVWFQLNGNIYGIRSEQWQRGGTGGAPEECVPG